jgi:hypothetical protein
MSPLELRYEIYKPLVRLGRDVRITDAYLISPVPGEPVKIRVIALDPWRKPRTYIIAITEE